MTQTKTKNQPKTLNELEENKTENVLKKLSFKIQPHKGVKLTDSIKEELKNKNGCRYDSQIYGAYICPIRSKEDIENLFNENKIKADLTDVVDFSPNKNKKIVSLENQINHLENKIKKEEGTLLIDVAQYDKQKYVSDFDKPPTIENFPENESEEIRSLKFSKEMDFHKRYLEIKEDKQKLENLRNSFSLHEKEVAEKIFRQGDFIVDVTGLYHFPVGVDGDKEPKKTWVSSPIWPEVYLRDKECENHSLLVRVYDGEKDHKVVLPRSIISKFPELCEILLNLGQTPPTYCTKLQGHLKNFLTMAKPKELMRCVHKAGWHGDQYVFPDGEVVGKALNTESVYPLNRDIPRGLKQKGTHEDWLKNIWELCANNSRLIFSVGVSLAAPCMYLTDEDSGGFNYVGDSSIGKSRCLETAISIYGSPDFKRSWKNTSNGFEAICSLHHDLLLPMDEGGQADPKELGENIYMFSQGQGKGRMYKDTNARDSKYWRAMLLSTAENGLNVLMQEANKKTKPGQLVRIADIPAAVEGKFGCFEDLHGFENGVDGEVFAEKIKEVTRKYYGTTGREFIRAIIKHGIDNAKEDLNNLADDFAADVARNYDGQVKRVANRFGLVYAALSLAIKLKVLNGSITDEAAMNAVKSCFLGWLGKRGTTGNMETSNIVEQVESLLIEHSDGKFIDVSEYTNDKKLRLTLWGCREESKFYVFCTAFKNHLCKGHDQEQVVKILLEAKILNPKLGEFQKKINGFNTRCYLIDLGEKHYS